MTALPGTRDAALLAIVARCRARAGVVSFVRSSAMACAVTLTVAVVTRLLWSGDSNVAVWMASAVAIGVACGATVAVRRYPSRREVAHRIDRHLNLEDTVVAAIQTQDGNAPVGPLILRQALNRAGDVNAAAVFPMELQRPAALLAAALLLVIATLPRSDRKPIGNSGSRSTSSSDAGAGTATDAREKAASGTLAQPGTRDGGAKTRENTTVSAESRPSDAPGSPQPPANGEQSARGRGSAPAAASGREAPGLARASAGAGARGGAGSAGSGPARGAGSGGVRGGTLIASNGATPTTPDQQPSPRYQQAQRNAEAALTRGDIPPELRSYVREYFRAITR